MAGTNMLGVMPHKGALTDVSVVSEEDFLGGTPADVGYEALCDYSRDLVSSYLEVRGLQIMDRPWGCAAGTIDLVARDGDCAVLVKVRTHVSSHRARISNADIRVLGSERHSFEQLAGYYLASHFDVDCVRCDVVSVHVIDGRSSRLRHVRGVFARGTR